jgi:hypothetical protein
VTVDKQAFAAFGVHSLLESTVFGAGLMGELCLCDVLDYLGECHQGRDYSVRYRLKPDTIEITAVKRGTPQETALGEALEAVRDHHQALVVRKTLARKLEQPFSLDTAVKPSPLLDVLDFISDRYDLTIIVNGQAFAAAGIDKVEEVQVSLPVQQNAKLGTVLQKIVDQVERGDWTAQFIPGFGLVGRDSDWRKRDFIEIAPLHKHVKHNKPLTEQQWTTFWDDLAGKKSGRMLLALDTLGRFPEQSVPRLRDQLKPVAAPDPRKLAEAARWIADLDNDQFAARQKATSALENLGSVALQPLKERLKNRPSLELRRRIEQLVQKLEQPASREELRAMRAIHILEEVGTAEAEKIIDTQARGYAGALQTDKARAALERLRR